MIFVGNAVEPTPHSLKIGQCKTQTADCRLQAIFLKYLEAQYAYVIRLPGLLFWTIFVIKNVQKLAAGNNTLHNLQNSHTIKENLTKKCSQAQCKT